MRKSKRNFILIGLLMVVSISVITLTFNKVILKQEETNDNCKDIAEKIYTDDNGYLLAYTINGKASKSSFPNKDSGLSGNSVTCKNGVTASWDNEIWGLVITNANNQNNIVCNVDFSKGTPIVEYITNLATTSSEIVEDETVDHNLRYIGADPSNYVQFNNELWRVIGVMNDVADENGKVESRVKLIRSESIGSYAWDNKASGTGSSTNQYGSNDWSDSALKEVLNNGAYYNRTSGECPSGKDGATISCDFSNTGLTEESKKMISKVKWKLGGTSNVYLSTNGFYIQERGTEVYSGHATEWIGSVGLMYPSDYGYATAGGATTDRNTCLSTSLYKWNETVGSDCYNNDWLYKSNNSQCTIMPQASSFIAIAINVYGCSAYHSVTNTAYIRPTIYLSTNTRIISGTGTNSDPYILET